MTSKLTVGDGGITVAGGEGTQASTLPWSAVRHFAPGFTLAFPDGRPATELEVALADRSLRFLVPANQLPPTLVAELVHLAPAPSPHAGSPHTGMSPAAQPPPGYSAAPGVAPTQAGAAGYPAGPVTSVAVAGNGYGPALIAARPATKSARRNRKPQLFAGTCGGRRRSGCRGRDHRDRRFHLEDGGHHDDHRPPHTADHFDHVAGARPRAFGTACFYDSQCRDCRRADTQLGPARLAVQR